MMKKITSLMLVILLFSLSACNIVTVVPIGEEAKFTGVKEFSADNEAEGQWVAVVENIESDAIDIKEVSDINNTAVIGSGVIKEFNTDTPKNYLDIEINDSTYRIQVGKVYSGTAIRDAQKLKKFEEFNNQTEWSQYAKSLNTLMHEKIIEPLKLDKNVEGKTAKFVGVAVNSDGVVLITPIELSIE